MEIKAKSKRMEDLKAYLEAERERLRAEIARSDLSTGEKRTGYSTHMADDATIAFEQAKNVSLRRSQEALLAEVEDALKRMENGTYGICQRCGRMIDLARLKAMPTAALCLACQELLEQRRAV
ncbi:MAG: TraR/DksA C4-type zinc finger protein [Anaerolineae bacterium]|nr:TraR/DksA C4-type zinc finger protein [Anaerolineae bacterium]